jgi:hypothetical protein
MAARKVTDLPAELKRTRRRFEQWRRTREYRSRIPQPAWTAAAEMARRYGINRTARALRVDYRWLKERAENETISGLEANGDAVPTSLELAAPATASTCEFTLEPEDVIAAKMRLHLKGVQAPEMVALSRSKTHLGSCQSPHDAKRVSYYGSRMP